MANNGPGHDDDRKDDKPFDGETRLFIRDNVLDGGSEPGMPPVWASPDITVTPPGGSAGDEFVIGVENRIAVTVRNGGGMPAIGVYVDAFACDPTTGWTPATAQLIGGTYVDIAPTSSSVAELGWTPPPGPSHRCLMARASLLIPADTYDDPSVFDVLNDRHVAQRNVNVVSMPANMMTLTFGFMVVNGLREDAEFVLLAEHLEPTPNNMRLVAGALGCQMVQFGQTPLRNFELVLGGRIEPGRQDPPERRMGVLPQPLRELSRAPLLRGAERGSSLRLKLGRGEVRQAFLTVARNPDTRPGDLHVVEVAQLDARTQQVTGGLWLALRH